MANRRGKSGSSDRLVCIVKATVFLVVMVFLVGMWEVDHKEGWALKNSWFQTVVLEKALESPLDCKEIQPKGNQPWIFTGRNSAEAETPILWPPYTKNQLTRNEHDSGKDWGQWEKGATEDEMAGWHHWLERTRVWANSRRQWRTENPGMLSGGCKQSDTTQQLNNNTGSGHKLLINFKDRNKDHS